MCLGSVRSDVLFAIIEAFCALSVLVTGPMMLGLKVVFEKSVMDSADDGESTGQRGLCSGRNCSNSCFGWVLDTTNTEGASFRRPLPFWSLDSVRFVFL